MIHKNVEVIVGRISDNMGRIPAGMGRILDNVHRIPAKVVAVSGLAGWPFARFLGNPAGLRRIPAIFGSIPTRMEQTLARRLCGSSYRHVPKAEPICLTFSLVASRQRMVV